MLEAIQMFTDRWLGKEIVVHSFKEIIHSNKNGQTTDTHDNTGEPQKRCAKWKEPDIKEHLQDWFHLYKENRQNETIGRIIPNRVYIWGTV